MLVISRRLNEQIIIDGDIRVTVCEIRGNRVKLGIHAPPERRIERVHVDGDRKAGEQQEAQR